MDAYRVSGLSGREPALVSPPPMSVQSIAKVLFASFAVIALVVPFALHATRWLKVEATIGAWWAVTMAVLVYVVSRARPLADDHTFVPFWKRFRNREYVWLLDGVGGSDPYAAIMGLIVLVVLIPILWIVIEAVAPLVFMLVYFGTKWALALGTVPRAALGVSFIAGIAASFVWLAHFALHVM